MHTKDHWDKIYATKDVDSVSWYAPHLDKSLALIEAICPDKTTAIVDIGAGESTLVDDLLSRGYQDLSVLDISQAAIEFTKQRLAGLGGLGSLSEKSKQVNWHVGDITRYDFGAKQFDLWHDRAVFHFLTDPDARASYINTLRRSVKPGGHVLMATFGPDGPLQCSGLDVVRYNQTQLQQVLGDGFKLLGSELTTHLTPMGSEQQFLHCWFEVVR